MQTQLEWLPVLVGSGGLLLALAVFAYIRRLPAGEGKMLSIAEAIHHGAMVFLHYEYTILAIFVCLLAVLLFFTLGQETALAALVGAACSAAAGYIGMRAATRANVRTAYAAHTRGSGPALSVAFFGGSVMGISVAALGLIGLGGLFYFFGNPTDAHFIHGFGIGASSVALFARVGGGIYTKSADVGADLAGKFEAGIPEDDPRNPGVIADNVGDNVGDVAGMGSDIFESYCGAMIATIAIASVMAPVSIEAIGERHTLMLLPLLLTTVGLCCSVVGMALVRVFSQQRPALALRSGTTSAALLYIVAAYFLTSHLDINLKIWWTVLIGAMGGIIIGLTTEYFTGGRPVRHIAESAQTGTGTVLITGLATGMFSVIIPVATIALMILLASNLIGVYGVGIAAIGMLGTVGMTMSIDAYGSVSDNAGGISEMAGLGAKTRAITDELDKLGNTTAAIGKGFAIGAAALASLAIISAYVETITHHIPTFTLHLGDPHVLVGLLIGGVFPFLISALTMTAVGDTAFKIIREIRRQFHEIDGLMEGTAQPDNARCITIATNAALKKMVLPGLIAITAPPVVGFIIGPEALGGMLGGAVVAGVLLALMMANAGGAWDNAKKYVEQGHLGGKGSDVHKACVVGDTVGDPFKDTSGPAMNILINVLAIVSLAIAPLLV